MFPDILTSALSATAYAQFSKFINKDKRDKRIVLEHVLADSHTEKVNQPKNIKRLADIQSLTKVVMGE